MHFISQMHLKGREKLQDTCKVCRRLQVASGKSGRSRRACL